LHSTEAARKVRMSSLCVVLAGALVACSGSAKNEATVSTPSPLVAPSAPAPAPNTTTTTIASTVRPATSFVTSATTTTNDAGGSSTAPPPAKVAVESKLRGLYLDAAKAVTDCMTDPAACDRAAMLARFVDPARADVDKLIADQAANGVRTRSPGVDKYYFVVESVRISDNLSGGAVTACIYDGRIQYRPGTAGGAEQIVDDAVSSYHQIWDFERDTDGEYRVDAVSTMDKDPNGKFVYKDVNICAPLA
jgi:hypothetical protein